MKFLCVKLVVFFCFWQSCLLSVLGSLGKLLRLNEEKRKQNLTTTPSIPQTPTGVFKPTNGWTTADVELGISALLICSEMVVFAVLHVYSFTYVPYIVPGVATNAFKSLWDGFNPIDLVREVLWACEDISLILRGREMRIRDQHSLSHKLERANTIRATRRHRFFNKIRNAHLPGRTGAGAGSAAGSNSTLGSTASTTPAPTSVPMDSTVVVVPTPATQDPRAALLSHLDGRLHDLIFLTLSFTSGINISFFNRVFDRRSKLPSRLQSLKSNTSHQHFILSITSMFIPPLTS